MKTTDYRPGFSRGLSLGVSLVALLFASIGCSSVTFPRPSLTYYHATNPATFEARADFWRKAGLTVRHVDGVSMEPYFSTCDYVVFRPLAPGEELKPGMVTSGAGFVHMVVEVRGDKFYMTGANNRNSDGWRDVSAVRWVVVEIIDLP